MEFTKIDWVLYEPKPKDDSKNISKRGRTNKLCVHIIKCGLSNKFFENHCHFTCAKDLRDEINCRYRFEDEGAKKFAMANLCPFKCLRKNVFLTKLKIFKN